MLLTVIITLLVYSLIGTIVFILTDENEDFARWYAIGIIGLIIAGGCYLLNRLIWNIKRGRCK